MVSSVSWWTSTHVLVLIDSILALSSLLAATAALSTIKSSNRVVSATEQQANALALQVDIEVQQLNQAKDVLLTSVRPLLVNVPRHTHSRMAGINRSNEIDLSEIYWGVNGDSIIIRVPFRNVGTGPAFVHRVFFSPKVGVVMEGTATSGVVPMQELVWATYVFAPGTDFYGLKDELLEKGMIDVGIQYSDLGGIQRLQSVLEIGKGDSKLYRFAAKRVRLYKCTDQWVPESEPFVESGDTEP